MRTDKEVCIEIVNVGKFFYNSSSLELSISLFIFSLGAFFVSRNIIKRFANFNKRIIFVKITKNE